MSRPSRLNRLRCRLLSDHGSEIVLLGLIACGVLLCVWWAIKDGQIDAIDFAAFLLVLQRIVEAVQKRWEQRGVDRLGEMVGQSMPGDGAKVQIDQPAGEPVPVTDADESAG